MTSLLNCYALSFFDKDWSTQNIVDTQRSMVNGEWLCAPRFRGDITDEYAKEVSVLLGVSKKISKLEGIIAESGPLVKQGSIELKVGMEI